MYNFYILMYNFVYVNKCVYICNKILDDKYLKKYYLQIFVKMVVN